MQLATALIRISLPWQSQLIWLSAFDVLTVASGNWLGAVIMGHLLTAFFSSRKFRLIDSAIFWGLLLSNFGMLLKEGP